MKNEANGREEGRRITGAGESTEVDQIREGGKSNTPDENQLAEESVEGRGGREAILGERM